MTRLVTIIILLIGCQVDSQAQAYFTSHASGNWNNAGSWTLVSGTSSTNYPVAGDSAILLGGQTIKVTGTMQCQALVVKAAATLELDSLTSLLTVTNNVTVTESSAILMNSGALTITGNLTINQASAINQYGGAISVVGLIFMTSPTSTTGATIVNVDAGVFSCVGGVALTATTFPAGRTAELKIGNSAVNILGALTTITANSKITFTGGGTLTLAGLISVSSPVSFTAGSGRVLYVGIPGSNQAVAPLTYNRLAIAGIGNGIKTISGNVTVTDTLSLLTDTLQVNNSGILQLSNNAVIVKTAGKLASIPTYLGAVDIIYNNLLKDTTGKEMPVSTTVLRNLIINDIAGITLSNSVTVNNTLALQNGELFTDNFILNISNAGGGTSADPAISRTNGYVKGTINRAIGTSTGVRVFPFGIGQNQGYRGFQLNYTTAPTSAGTLSVQHFNVAAASQTGLPITDGSSVIVSTTPYYWQADATNLSGGNYTLTLTGEGTTAVPDFSTLRIVKRPSAGGNWILNGTAGINSGSNTAPVVVRNGMSGFSQFSIGLNTTGTLPLTLLNFTATARNGAVTLDWKSSNEINTAYFNVQKSNDGRSFGTVGKVYASPLASAVNSYQYLEANVLPGKYFYKLQIIDRDSRATESYIVTIDISKTSAVLVYPTVFESTISISSANAATIVLYNSNGQFIKKLQSGSNDLSDLTKGWYIVKVNDQAIRIVKD